ncbi:hypothetical protein Tco_0050246, partial [Tanacetum coccineum]
LKKDYRKWTRTGRKIFLSLLVYYHDDGDSDMVNEGDSDMHTVRPVIREVPESAMAKQPF